MKLPWAKSPARGRRQPGRIKRAWKKIDAILSSPDPFVYSGLVLMSIAIGTMTTISFGAGYGVGAGVLTMGSGLFGLGIWLLPPRTKGPE